MNGYIILHRKPNGEFVPSTYQDGVQPVYSDFKEAAVVASKLHNAARETFVFAITENLSILNTNETPAPTN